MLACPDEVRGAAWLADVWGTDPIVRVASRRGRRMEWSSGRSGRAVRISWDEMRSLKLEHDFIVGEASIPTMDGNRWARFHINATTGECVDGVYNVQTRQALRIHPDA